MGIGGLKLGRSAIIGVSTELESVQYSPALSGGEEVYTSDRKAKDGGRGR